MIIFEIIFRIVIIKINCFKSHIKLYDYKIKLIEWSMKFHIEAFSLQKCYIFNNKK